MVMNNSFSENPYYYGKVFMTGSADIGDSIENLSIYVNAITEEGTFKYSIIRFFRSCPSRFHIIYHDTNSSETIETNFL